MSTQPPQPTPHTPMPRDGWSDGPFVSTLFANGHLIAQVSTKSLDCYDLTRLNAHETPLWIGRASDLEASKKQVELFVKKNGQGAEL